MKKTELKKILKPLIKECVKEVILDDGILSGIISEVARGGGGVSVASVIAPTDPAAERMRRNAFNSEQSNKLQEHKKKLMNAIGGEAYNGVNLFEGTSPAPTSERGPAGPMANQTPTDAGVDISGIFGAVGSNWNAHMNELKERK